MRMEANISSVLRQDTECISAVHCLKVFCQRLGCDLSSGEAVRRVAGCAFALATEALSDLAVLQFPPSLTAAAVLVAARRAQARPLFLGQVGAPARMPDMCCIDLRVCMHKQALLHATSRP